MKFNDGDFEQGDIELDAVYEPWGSTANGGNVYVSVPAISNFTNVDTVVRNNFQDVFSLRLGGAFNIRTGGSGVFTLRAGTYYESPSTLPADTRLDFNTLAKYAGTIGIGYSYRGVGLNLAFAEIYSSDRVVTNGDVAPINPAQHGQSIDSAGNPFPAVNNGTYDASIQMLSFGVRVELETLFGTKRSKRWSPQGTMAYDGTPAKEESKPAAEAKPEEPKPEAEKPAVKEEKAVEKPVEKKKVEPAPPPDDTPAPPPKKTPPKPEEDGRAASPQARENDEDDEASGGPVRHVKLAKGLRARHPEPRALSPVERPSRRPRRRSAALAACSRQPPAPEAALPPSHEARADLTPRGPSATSRRRSMLRAEPQGRPASSRHPMLRPTNDPMATHFMTQADLLHLLALPPPADDRAAARRSSLLAYLVAPSPGHFNDGNRALARHAISRAQCLAGLKDTVVQTDEQRAICKGEAYMVPIYMNGDPHSARTCIDQFEFPDEPCELPFVWGSPSEAEQLCRVEGKRLCTQQEWTLGCSADPAGKGRWPYAYGDKLDMTICNTNKPHEAGPDGKAWRCWVRDATTTWNTCSTDTEPGGSFPRCRSRLGVYDQHGNVAEEMTRGEGGVIYTQLKGSAFFYTDVAHEMGKTAAPPRARELPRHLRLRPALARGEAQRGPPRELPPRVSLL